MDMCPALPPATGFISSMTAYIDCQAQILGSGTWSALAAPGSTLAVLLTGLLTIFIALIGYNLLLGQTMTVRAGTLAFVKIGAVFALATSWPAYRTLIYDVVTDGPSQLVAEIGPQAGVIGSDGSLVQRLDLTDRALVQLAILGPGTPPANTAAEAPPPPFTGFDAFALGSSKILFELTAVASLGIVRVIMGLMLGLGPFFIAFLLFEDTRSLFEGWVRVVAGTALAAIGVSVALGLELGLLAPWLTDVLARRSAGEVLPTVSTELFVIVALFAMLITTLLYTCAHVARAFRLAVITRTSAVAAQRGKLETFSRSVVASEVSREIAERERSRAAAVASVLIASTRRERGDPVVALVTPAVGSSGAIAASNSAPEVRAPVGRSFARRARARASAMTTRRDTRA